MLPKMFERSKPPSTGGCTQASPIPPLELTEVASIDEMARDAEAAVDDLSEQFENWMKVDLDRLCQAWEEASAANAIAEHYRKLFTAAHDIRGVAISYGFPAISRLCGSLCTLLSFTKPGDNSQLINLHVEACRAAYLSNSQSGAVDKLAYAVCEALERRVAVNKVTGL